MQEIFVEELGLILKNKLKIEKSLGIRILNHSRDIIFEGKAENEFIALNFFEAIKLGFSVDKALLLKNDQIILQILNIKDLTKRKDLREIKARIIGTEGKTIANLCLLTGCHFSIKDNRVGVIGDAEDISEAVIALESLIKGAKQANVYSRLEKERKKKKIKKMMPIKNEFKDKKETREE
jgi:KH domain-containing protein